MRVASARPTSMATYYGTMNSQKILINHLFCRGIGGPRAPGSAGSRGRMAQPRDGTQFRGSARQLGQETDQRAKNEAGPQLGEVSERRKSWRVRQSSQIVLASRVGGLHKI